MARTSSKSPQPEQVNGALLLTPGISRAMTNGRGEVGGWWQAGAARVAQRLPSEELVELIAQLGQALGVAAAAGSGLTADQLHEVLDILGECHGLASRIMGGGRRRFGAR